MSARAETPRYTAVAIALHWAIALSMAGLIGAGVWMADAEEAPRDVVFAVYQAHKTFGILVLLLTLARLGWRIACPPPPLPEGMKSYEVFAATATHWAFYAVMIALPVTGWAMVSASPTGVPTQLFGAIPWPHLPIATSHDTEEALKGAHRLLAYGSIALIGLHVAAALKHQFINGDRLLARVLPGLFGATGAPRPAARWAPAAFVAPAMLALAIILIGQSPAPSGADEAAAPAGDVAVAAGPDAWIVDPEQSRLTFSGVNAGAPFEGVFGTWTAEIVFDPEDLANARVLVRIPTATAATGNTSNDSTLREADWLAPETHPEARFETQAITPGADSDYVAEATLSLKGVAQNVRLPFELTIEGDAARASGAVTVDRTTFGIGVAADPSGDWVAKEVVIAFDLVAARAP